MVAFGGSHDVVTFFNSQVENNFLLNNSAFLALFSPAGSPPPSVKKLNMLQMDVTNNYLEPVSVRNGTIDTLQIQNVRIQFNAASGTGCIGGEKKSSEALSVSGALSVFEGGKVQELSISDSDLSFNSGTTSGALCLSPAEPLVLLRFNDMSCTYNKGTHGGLKRTGEQN